MSQPYTLVPLGVSELALSRDECRKFLNREAQREGSIMPPYASGCVEHFNNPTVEALMAITPDMWVEIGLHPEVAETTGNFDRFAVVRLADKLGVERPTDFHEEKQVSTVSLLNGKRVSVHDPELFRELMDAARERFVHMNEATNTPFHALSGEQKHAMTNLYSAYGLDIAKRVADSIEDLEFSDEIQNQSAPTIDALDLDSLSDAISQQV